MNKFLTTIVFAPVFACPPAHAQTQQTTSEAVVSVSGSYIAGDPSTFSSSWTYAFSLANFNESLGTLTEVTIDVDVVVNVFVTGSSKSVPPTGGVVAANVNGEAGAKLMLEGDTLAESPGAQFIQMCSASGAFNSCILGDGSLITSTPAADVTLDFDETRTSGFEPFLDNTGVPLSLTVDWVATANGDVNNASVWARTFGIPTSIARATITYHYTTGTPDTDLDGVGDDIDNCREAANADQLDTDGDGIGNACDADLNNDCAVNFGDLAALKLAFFPNPYDVLADFNGDGAVNFGDLAFMKSTFFNGANPGPGPGAPGNACES